MKNRELSRDQLEAAITFGMGVTDDYKEMGEPVPAFVYEKLIAYQAQLIEKLKGGK